MKIFENESYTGERALYNTHDAKIVSCVFFDGESPLKECSNLLIENSTFKWKYPIWYTSNVKCENVTFLETARSGLWYIDNIEINNSKIEAPKLFRRSKNIRIINSDIPNALETFWKCENITLNKVNAKGDYFCFNCSSININNFTLLGNYAFDGSENIVIENSSLQSKDSFWNSKNVVVKNSTLIGEYIGWNSEDLTFINCKIVSHQGFCYIKNLKLINCEISDSDLIFERCENIEINAKTKHISIKNPYSGKIHVSNADEIILDENIIDKSKVEIIIDEKI